MCVCVYVCVHIVRLGTPNNQLKICFYYSVTAMVMGEAGNREAIWTVQVGAPTEIHMMVTVRYDSLSVKSTDDHCGAKKSCTNNQPNHIDYRSLQ